MTTAARRMEHSSIKQTSFANAQRGHAGGDITRACQGPSRYAARPAPASLNRK